MAGRKKTLNVGILGLGLAGDIHGMAWQGNADVARIVAVCDKDEAVAKAFARSRSVEAFYTDVHEFFDHEGMDAVSICVPNDLHADFSVEAVEAGKHVLLEKPIANTLGEADKIISAAKKAKVKLMVAENLLFLPVHRLIRQLVVEEGRIGRVFLAAASQIGNDVPIMAEPGGWQHTWIRAGGGILMDSGVHRLHLYRWLLGDVDRVYCWIAKQVVRGIKGKAEDNAIMILRFKNEALAQLTVSLSATMDAYDDRLELYGTDGTIIEDHAWKKPLLVYSTKPGLGQNEWYRPEVEHEPFPVTYRISFTNEVRHFADCITSDKQPESTGEDGRAALEITLLGYLSAKTHREARPGDITSKFRASE